MTQRQAYLVQTILEAAIPVLGYFFWHWDLSFLLLFYLLDWLLAFGVLIAKGNKRIAFLGNNTEKPVFIRHLLTATFTLTATCVLTGTGVTLLHPGLNWWQRTIEFMTYEDMGVSQGLFLIPLMILNGYLVYKQQFLIPARYRTLQVSEMMQPFLRQGWILLAASGLLLASAALIRYPEEIVIALLIAGTSAYRWLVLRSH